MTLVEVVIMAEVAVTAAVAVALCSSNIRIKPRISISISIYSYQCCTSTNEYLYVATYHIISRQSAVSDRFARESLPPTSGYLYCK